jgi:hypothetical protein
VKQWKHVDVVLPGQMVLVKATHPVQASNNVKDVCI